MVELDAAGVLLAVSRLMKNLFTDEKIFIEEKLCANSGKWHSRDLR